MEKCKTEQEYLDQIIVPVQRACKRYGYLPSVLIAQSCLENGYGIPDYWDNEQIGSLIKYNNMLDSNDALVDEFSRRGKEDKANFFVGFMVFDAYYTMNKKEWIDKTNQNYRNAVETRFSEYFKKHLSQWQKLSEQEKMIISNNIRTRSVNEGMPMESITIDTWLRHISEVSK